MELQEIKRRIDLHDLADKLGLERPQANGNYRSPHHDDKAPSLSIYSEGKKWKDFSADMGGDCFDLVVYVEGCDDAEAIARLRSLYNFPVDQKGRPQNTQLSQIEYIARQCLKDTDKAIEYLVKERGIHLDVIKAAIARKTLGFSDYTSTKYQAGQLGYGGDAVAFICYDRVNKTVRGVDYRYFNPSLNGDLKTKSQGDKDGVLWTSCWSRVKSAHTVVVVESAINALSAESAWQVCNRQGFAVIAVRGTQNKNVDWGFLVGKRVILAFDNDLPIEKGPKKGYRPGLFAAWETNEAMTAVCVASQLINHQNELWSDINDLNDFYKKHGALITCNAINDVEPWLIPGLPGSTVPGKSRLHLPPHDFAAYWRYRCKADFTAMVKISRNEDGEEVTNSEDLCGFRVAALSRITIASANATLTGADDGQPTIVYVASMQTARHENTLVRQVIRDDGLYNIASWSKVGPVFKPQQFFRMLNIWERATHIGSRTAANYVGLCFREGKPAVNSGLDCFFTEPEKQCPYHNLTFPSGSRHDGVRVVNAYQATMRHNAALSMLVWGLGGHLKPYLGFWPHMVLQADKGSGKTTLIKAMETSIAFTMFSGQSLGSEFRLVTSVSHTSHPVGWEELSARRQDVIDKAVALLQETYQFSVTRRGSEMTEYCLSAPVLLAGEDVPVDSLQGKLVRSQLTGRKGDLLPEGLPQFPVREWLQFLASLDPARVRELHRKIRDTLLQRSAGHVDDDGASRIVNNYAALGVAWQLLCEFLDMAKDQGGFPQDLIAEMNAHIIETRSSRDPWVWIVEIILSEIDRHQFDYPYKFEFIDGQMCLLVRPTHCMSHLSQTPALRAKFDALPVKTAKVFSKQLARAGVILTDGLERTIARQRVGHLYALSVEKLGEYGLSVSTPDGPLD